MPPRNRTQEALGLAFAHDRLEDGHERVGQLVGQVVLRVERNVVLQHIDRVLKQEEGRKEGTKKEEQVVVRKKKKKKKKKNPGLFVGGSALAGLDNDVRHTVAHGRRRPGVALAHALRQFDVRLLAGVVFLGLAQLLRDDQLR